MIDQHQFVKNACKESLGAFCNYMYPEFRMPAHIQLLIKKLRAVEEGKIKRLIINMPPRHGKLIADNVPTLTTEGWKKHGDLEVGDYVYNLHGKEVRIIETSLKDQANYKITFSNGDVIYCHENHEWVIEDRHALNKRKQVETNYFLKHKLCIPGKNGKSRYRFFLPNISCIEYPEQNLGMHPYVLGAWLGDGTSAKPCITHSGNDIDVINKIIKCGYNVSNIEIHKKTKVHTTYFSSLDGKKGRLISEIRELNLYRNKHIPDKYKKSSIEQRLELIAGLIDTDGHVDKAGRVRISNCNKRLIDDIIDILNSLNFRPYLMEYEPCISSSGIQGKQIVYQVGFNPTLKIPTALERKQINRLIKQRRISINKVEYDNQGYFGKCIQVDSDDGLYLVGKSLIPTHNSQLTSKLFPAWFLGRNPKKNIIFTTYSQTFAEKISRSVRQFMTDQRYIDLFPDSRLTCENLENLITAKGGEYKVAGVGGAITGMGADLLLIDDPHKNRQEASSKVMRENIVDWFNSTLFTRLSPNAAMILIQTRWHSDDLAGYLQTAQKGIWEVISMPALDDDNNPLWPDQFDLERLLEIKQTIGIYEWSALYQQTPVADGGNIIKREWIRTYSELPEVKRYSWSWDTAIKTGQENDYSVGTLWAECDNGYYLINMFKEKLEYPELRKVVNMLYNKQKTSEVLIEDKASGQQILQDFKRIGTMPVISMMPGKDMPTNKEERMHLISPLFEAGKVFIPEDADWTFNFVEELIQFPNGKHDDICDSTSQYLARRLNMQNKKPNIRVL